MGFREMFSALISHQRGIDWIPSQRTLMLAPDAPLEMEMGTGTNEELAPGYFSFAGKLLCPLATLYLCSPHKEVCSHIQ